MSMPLAEFEHAIPRMERPRNLIACDKLLEYSRVLTSYVITIVIIMNEWMNQSVNLSQKSEYWIFYQIHRGNIISVIDGAVKQRP